MGDFEDMLDVEDFQVGGDYIPDGYDDDGDTYRYGDEYDDDGSLYDMMFPNGYDDGYED